MTENDALTIRAHNCRYGGAIDGLRESTEPPRGDELWGSHTTWGLSSSDYFTYRGTMLSPFFGSDPMGDKPEVFTFPYEPHNVREFWSVTRHSLLTRNTLPGLNDIYNAYNTVPNDDGYVTITFSADDPNDGTCWMPVIDGEPDYFIVRYYGPDLEAPPRNLRPELGTGSGTKRPRITGWVG